MPVLTLHSDAHLLPLLVCPHPRLCLRVLNHVSLCLLLSSRLPWTPLLHRRLNSRDGLRNKLAADPQNGIMITIPTLRFTSDSKPGGNTSGTTTDAVTDTMGLGSTEPTSRVRVSCNVLLQVENIPLTCRISPKSGVTVHFSPRSSHDANPNPSCTIHLGSRTSQDTCHGRPCIEMCGFTGGYLC